MFFLPAAFDTFFVADSLVCFFEPDGLVCAFEGILLHANSYEGAWAEELLELPKKLPKFVECQRASVNIV